MIKKRGLLLIAGSVWIAAGINILRIGITSMFLSVGNGVLWLDVGLPFFSIVIFSSFILMFYKSVSKHTKRILGYESKKVSIFRFFDIKGYLLMAFMMGLGIVLRKSNLLPNWFFAFFYTGLGSALILSGFRFIVCFFNFTFRQILWIVTGILSFGLGTVGVFLPILPTVPLYLLASFSFLSSSQTLYNRFMQSKLCQRYLKPYLDAGGLTKGAKLFLIIFVSIQIFIAAFLARESVFLLCFLGFLYLGFLVSMFFVVKTIRVTDIIKDKE